MGKVKWRIEKRGEWYRGRQHGPVKIIVEDGVIVSRPARVTTDLRAPEQIRVDDLRKVYMVDHRMSEDEVSRRISGLTIKLR